MKNRKYCVDKKSSFLYNTNKYVKAMTRISSNKSVPTESCRQVRGAGYSYYEYLFELRTELTVGCDGFGDR